MVKKVNSTLEDESPEFLVTFLETLVALMRNVDHANNIDVEIYFKEFDKLQRKFQKLDVAGFKVDNVNKHQAALKS